MIVTRTFLESLFSSFSLPLPDDFKTPVLPILIPGDTLPPSVIEEEVAYTGTFVLCAGIYLFSADLAPATLPDNGVAHTSYSFTGEWENGWLGIETVLIRLNSSYAGPNANLPVWNADPIDGASGVSIGYDAAVCLEMYEPWIVQIYNSSLGVSTTMAIVGKSATTDFETDYGNRGPHLDSYTRVLNSTGKELAYYVRYAGGFSFERYRPILCSHDSAIWQMMKDNDARRRYAPSPTTVSFTGNIGPEGYTELSTQFYADVRGRIDASNVLPFLSGTGPIVVRAYKDVVLASASFKPYILCGVLGIALVLGALAGLFVPALPLDIPRRGFGLFSWVALLRGQELGGEFWQDKVDRHMDLDELEKTVGEEKVHFII